MTAGSRRSHARNSTAAGLLVLTVLGAATFPATANPRPPFPVVQLPAEAQGEAAIRALGRDLPAVAAHYRMSAERLRSLLRRDNSARIDRVGRLFFVEPEPEFAPLADGPSLADTTTYPLSETFALNSKPGAQRTLYLDLNGQSFTNTAWNGGATINAQPYDTDGNPASFSSAELTAIQKIWQRVAEDYAPFDVNVTTAEPAPDALRRTSSSDSVYGTRVVITRNTFYNCSCGGVAYLGTFDYISSSNPDFYQPAWVFFDALGNGNEKFVAEAASHEAGHNLGLAHDGRTNPVEGYYAGHGSGATGWAPIMGVGYNRALSQWSRGEYGAASNTEDDLAVIVSNGAPMRADEAGGTLASAINLDGTSRNGSVVVDRSGIIGHGSDADLFAFVSAPGSVQFNIDPATLGANLDLEARLLDSSGNLLAVSTPVDTLGASLNVSVAGGSYFVHIDGVGKGDLLSGYSDYGSLGHYRIAGTYADTGAVAPVAGFTAAPASGTAPLPVTFDASGSSDADGGIVGYAWTFGDGATASGLTAAHTYTSAGTFTATLTVTDSDGLSDSESVQITVNAALQVIYVRSIAVTAATVKGGYQCTAAVTIQSGSNGTVSGASVSGNWSGTITGAASGTTNGAGVASLKSAKTKKRGTCSFGVTSVSANGGTYQASSNLQGSGSATY